MFPSWRPTDAHSTREFGLVRYGIDQVRRAGLGFSSDEAGPGLFVGGRSAIGRTFTLGGDELGGFSRERGEAGGLQVRFNTSECRGVFRGADHHSENVFRRAKSNFRPKPFSAQQLHKYLGHAPVYRRYLEISVARNTASRTRNERRRLWFRPGGPCIDRLNLGRTRGGCLPRLRGRSKANLGITLRRTGATSLRTES